MGLLPKLSHKTFCTVFLLFRCTLSSLNNATLPIGT